MAKVIKLNNGDRKTKSTAKFSDAGLEITHTCPTTGKTFIHYYRFGSNQDGRGSLRNVIQDIAHTGPKL